MLRKHAAILTAATLLTASTAFAEAPTSQFGYKGWPYRVTTPCTGTTSPQATTCPDAFTTICPDNSQNELPCPTNEVCDTTDEPSSPTCAPDSPNVTPVPDVEATAVPTKVPALPTAKPTITATVQPTVVPTQAPSMDEDYTTDSVSAQEQKAWNLVNADRNANGLGNLTLDPELCRIARLKSEDMRDKNYFAHQSPTYGSASQMLTAFGYSYSGVGENIAHHATVEKSQAAFMSSDGHRRNILGASWTKVGIGVCYDKNGFVYVTQMFVR